MRSSCTPRTSPSPLIEKPLPVDDPERIRRFTARILAWRARHAEAGGERSIEEQRKLLLQMGYVGLAEELDEDTTLEEVREQIKAGRARREARRTGRQDEQGDEEQDG